MDQLKDKIKVESKRADEAEQEAKVHFTTDQCWFPHSICRRWLLWITEYGVVRRQGAYDDSVDVYAYHDILLWWILSLYLVGGH